MNEGDTDVSVYVTIFRIFLFSTFCRLSTIALVEPIDSVDVTGGDQMVEKNGGKIHTSVTNRESRFESLSGLDAYLMQ